VRKLFKRRSTTVLLVCLIVVGMLAAMRWYLKSRLEAAREAMIAAFADRLGVTVEYGSATLDGGGTLVLTGVNIYLPEGSAEEYFLRCARAEAEADLWALLRGEPALRRVDVLEPQLRLVLGKDGRIALPSGLRAPTGPAAEKVGPHIFRSGTELSVQDGTLAFIDERRDETLTLEDVRGTFSTEDRPGLELRGIPADAPLAWISVATDDGVDVLRVQAGSLPGSFIDKWVLDGSDLVRGGELDGLLSVRLARNGDLGLRGTVEFRRLDVKDVPAYLGRLTGTAHLDVAKYHDEARYSIQRVEVETDTVAGTVEGELSLAGDTSAGTLTVKLDKFPFERLAESELARRLPQLDRPRVWFDPGTRLIAQLRLPLSRKVPACRAETPGWRFSAVAAGGGLELEFGDTTANWGEDGEGFTAGARLTGGTVELDAVNETVRVTQGALDVDGARIQFSSLALAALGGAVSAWGSVTVDDPVALDLDYEARRVDAVRFGQTVGAERLFTGGRCDVRGKVYGPPERPVVTGELNLVETELRWSRWFEKKVGVLGTARTRYDRTGDRPNLVIESARLGDVGLTGRLEFGSDNTVRQIRLDFDSAAPAGLGTLFRLPLDIDGRGRSTFTVAYTTEEGVTPVELVGTASELVTVPRGADAPDVTGTDVKITIHPGTAGSATDFDVYARAATVPETIAEMQTWLAAFRTPASKSQYQSNLVVRADSVSCGRADARGLYGRFTISPDRLRCDSFTVAPYKGSLTAHYDLDRASGRYTGDMAWKQVALEQFLAWVMNDKPYVVGELAGRIEIKGELDNPDSRTGGGYIEVTRGEVDPLVLAARLQGAQPPETPVPIEFKRLHTSVEIEGNTIHTPDITIDKEGLTFNGSGSVTLDGEADYELNIVLAPELVDQIPLLTKRQLIPLPPFAQSKLPLRFRIQRKAGEVTGSVEDRRFHIQLLERTVEVSSDAVDTGVKVLELPAQLLYQVLQYIPKARRNNSE